MRPTETLKHEHKIVLMVLQGAEREANSIKGGAAVHAEKIEQMVDFFKSFVDRCHHAKEERHLFSALQAKGFPTDSGPVAVMLHEHEQGRAAVRAIAGSVPGARSGDRAAAGALAKALLAYVELLRSHIFKEDNVLFPIADQALSADEQRQLTGLFDKVEEEEIGPGVHERYHQLAHELAGA